jgi:N-acetylmuramoyl-L-alanine amidase
MKKVNVSKSAWVGRIKKIAAGLAVTAAVGGFLFVWSLVGDYESIMASARLDTAWERQVVVLDAGHGGMDGGCVSVDGTAEAGINLAITQNARDLLNIMGFETVLTRNDGNAIYDEGVEGLSNQKKSDMENRLKIFSGYENAISLSIHQNQFTDSLYSGAQMFYSRKNSAGERLALAMQNQFVSLLQPENTRETKPVDDELYLLDNTENAAIMIECGFLSNPQEAQKLESDEYQKQVAFTVMTGIFEYMNG